MHRSLLICLFLALVALIPSHAPAQAATQWRKFQDNPLFSGFIEPFEMVVEQDLGATFIAGLTRGGPGRGDDIYVARYSAAGTLEWIRNFDGGFANNDQPWGIALDSADNVYVAGFSERGAAGKDMLLLKYAPDGTFQWSRTYHGGSGDDQAQDVVVDKFQNIVVVGESLSPMTGVRGLVTIKYSPAGAIHWIRRLDSNPAAASLFNAMVDVDSIGNIFVGCSTTGVNGEDFSLVRYNLNSSFAWIRRWDHSGQTDTPRDVQVAPDGVYLCGTAQEGLVSAAALVKHGFDGAFMWADTFSPPDSIGSVARAMAVNSQGVVTYTGAAFFIGNVPDELTRSFNPDSSPRWTFDLHSNPADTGADIAADAFGNFYVVGFKQGAGTDAMTKRYSSTGAIAWQSLFNGPGNLDDANVGVGLDRHGNVITTGFSDTATKRLMMTQKFIQAGVAVADTFTALEAQQKSFPAPGVMANDWFTDGAVATLVVGPQNGTFNLNGDGSFNYRSNPGFFGTDTFTYRLVKGAQMGNIVNVNIVVSPLVPTNLVFNPSTIYSGQTTLGRVTINGVAPSGGTTIAITKNSGILTGPDFVTVPEGATTALFPIKAGPVPGQVVRTVTVTRAGVSRTASITINPSPALVSLIISPNSVTGGSNTAGRVTLAAPAPPGGLPVSISDDSAAATTPQVVVIPAGATFANFVIGTSAVGEITVVQVTATLNGVNRTANLTINP